MAQSAQRPDYNFIAEPNEINLIEHDFAIRQSPHFYSSAPARERALSHVHPLAISISLSVYLWIRLRLDFTLTLALRCFYPFILFFCSIMLDVACGRPIKCCPFQFNAQWDSAHSMRRRNEIPPPVVGMKRHILLTKLKQLNEIQKKKKNYFYFWWSPSFSVRHSIPMFNSN